MKKLLTSIVCLTAISVLAMSSISEAALENRPAVVEAKAAKDVALTLVFSAGVDLAASAVKITDSRGNAIPTGNLRFGTDGHNVEIPLRSALRPGVYSISWHAVSIYGQDSVGGYDFTIDPIGNQVPTVAQQ